MPETKTHHRQFQELLEKARQVFFRSQELTQQTEELLKRSRELKRDSSFLASEPHTIASPELIPDQAPLYRRR